MVLSGDPDVKKKRKIKIGGGKGEGEGGSGGVVEEGYVKMKPPLGFY